jgi:hypothetical protein
MTNRRQFIVQLSLGSAALLAGRAIADSGAVSESDPQATALGYKMNASKVDKSKYPTYAAGQACGTCALYQGKSGDKSGPCPLFAGKQVAATGWCSAWSKKA